MILVKESKITKFLTFKNSLISKRLIRFLKDQNGFIFAYYFWNKKFKVLRPFFYLKFRFVGKNDEKKKSVKIFMKICRDYNKIEDSLF